MIERLEELGATSLFISTLLDNASILSVSAGDIGNIGGQLGMDLYILLAAEV